jgi:hypothetical protein
MGEAMATARVGPTRLNGKVERSHRVDDQEFYQLLDRDGISDDIHLFNDKLREWEDYYNYHRPHGALRGQTRTNGLSKKRELGCHRGHETLHFLKRNGFPASPADHPRALRPKSDRPLDFRKSGRCIGGSDAPVRSASPASLPLRHRRLRSGRAGALAGRAWRRHGTRPRVPCGARQVSSVGARATLTRRSQTR